VSINNPFIKEELKRSVRDIKSSVSAAEHRRAMNRLYMTHVCGSKENFSVPSVCVLSPDWSSNSK
jgi:hypothetical protein